MGRSTTTSTTPDPAEVRAADQARVGVDGDDSNTVEQRAVGAGTTVQNRRAQADPRLKRAETRGIYRDNTNGGARRVVGAGQVIPDGWERIESATVSDRTIESSREQHASGEPIGDASGGPAAAAE